MTYLRNGRRGRGGGHCGWTWRRGPGARDEFSEEKEAQTVEGLYRSWWGFSSEKDGYPWGLRVDVVDSTALQIIWPPSREQTAGGGGEGSSKWT